MQHPFRRHAASTTRARVGAIASTAGAALALAPSAAAAVSVTSSASTTFLGASVTLKIRSDAPGSIVVRQLRVSKMEGPGRCVVSIPYFNGYIGGRGLKTINYTTPGTVVSVSLPATSLEFFGGNVLAGLPNGLPEDSRCDDFVTQFTRISAWQSTATGYDVNHMALTRAF